MPHLTDATHDPRLHSWVDSAQDPDGDFPIQNLPVGVFRPAGDDAPPRIGVAIGAEVFDVRGATEAGLLDDLDDLIDALRAPSLNELMAAGPPARTALRRAVSALLAAENPALRDDTERRALLMVPMDDAEMLLPAVIGDYTDFYASIHHATNVGSMFRPDNPLLPNYRHLPVGYHGRASSIVISGTPVRRPCGQTMADGADAPSFGPSRLLDYELEMGCFVGAGNLLGHRVRIDDAEDHLFGMVIVNDWSARDVQKWEYQPLGPFNAKNFATTISPWVVTIDALAPFRIEGPPRGEDDAPVIDYLRPSSRSAQRWGLDLRLEVYLTSSAMRERDMAPMLISRGGFSQMYWTLTQMLAHHTSTGCNMRPGDLLASGTVSGPEKESRGCLLERTWRGQEPLHLPDGTERRFLQDGDEVIMRAYAEREGAARIGFGECRGVVLPVDEG